MTKLLYLTNHYLKEFEAIVTEVINVNKIILDQTCFYPQGGGQPCDFGKIINSNNEEFNIVNVKKEFNSVVHEIDRE